MHIHVYVYEVLSSTNIHAYQYIYVYLHIHTYTCEYDIYTLQGKAWNYPNTVYTIWFPTGPKATVRWTSRTVTARRVQAWPEAEKTPFSAQQAYAIR